MIFITSDTHYGHSNVIKFDRRPFYSITNMNNELTFRWNEVVAPGDLIIHCGDFALTGSDNKRAIVNQLNGKIILIKGNHDRKGRIHWEENIGIAKFIKDGIFLPKSKVAIIHNPADIPNPDEFRIICHGHIHSSNGVAQQKIGKTEYINVGVDFRNYAPISLNSILYNYYRRRIFFKEFSKLIESWGI